MRASVEDSKQDIREYKGDNMGAYIEQKVRAIVFPETEPRENTYAKCVCFYSLRTGRKRCICATWDKPVSHQVCHSYGSAVLQNKPWTSIPSFSMFTVVTCSPLVLPWRTCARTVQAFPSVPGFALGFFLSDLLLSRESLPGMCHPCA